MLISDILKLAIFRAVRLSVWKYLTFWNLPFPGLFVSLYENIWKFKTYYFQDCLSLCTQLWRGCFCTKTRPAPLTQLPLPAGNLDTISFTYLLLDGFERTNSVCKVTLLQNNLFLHSPSLYVGAEASLFLSLLSCCCVPFLFPDFTSEKRKLFVYLDVHSIEWKGNFANKKPNFAKKILGIVPSHCHSPCTSKMYVIPILDLCNLHC